MIIILKTEEELRAAILLHPSGYVQRLADGTSRILTEEDVPAESFAILSQRQFKMALTAIGLRASAEAFIDNARDAGEWDILDWWNNTDFQIDHPVLAEAASQLGVTERMPELFKVGVSL